VPLIANGRKSSPKPWSPPSRQTRNSRNQKEPEIPLRRARVGRRGVVCSPAAKAVVVTRTMTPGLGPPYSGEDADTPGTHQQPDHNQENAEQHLTPDEGHDPADD